MHAVRQPADVQPAPGEVGLGLVEEAVGVADMPGDAAKLLQLFERQPPRPVEHVLFVEEVFLVLEVVAQVAEQRYGLIADLSGAQRGPETRAPPPAVSRGEFPFPPACEKHTKQMFGSQSICDIKRSTHHREAESGTRFADKEVRMRQKGEKVPRLTDGQRLEVRQRVAAGETFEATDGSHRGHETAGQTTLAAASVTG